MSKDEKYKHEKKVKNIFHRRIEDKDQVIVLFYATWCAFSQRFLPIFEEYSKSNLKDCLTVIIDDDPEVCQEYSINYYPTVIIFKKGKVQKRLDSKLGIGLNKKQLIEFTEN